MPSSPEHPKRCNQAVAFEGSAAAPLELPSRHRWCAIASARLTGSGSLIRTRLRWVRVRPSFTRAGPRWVRVRPSLIRARPPWVRVRPSLIRAGPRWVRVRPSLIRARPCWVRVRPPLIRARPRWVRVRPSLIRARPCWVRVRPSLNRARPRKRGSPPVLTPARLYSPASSHSRAPPRRHDAPGRAAGSFGALPSELGLVGRSRADRWECEPCPSSVRSDRGHQDGSNPCRRSLAGAFPARP
jgi:hypothetical protein